MTSGARVRSVRDSVGEYGRGIAGGLLFSLPLLYTMEVWWQGFLAYPEKILGYLAMTFVLLLGYNRFAGVREDVSWVEVVMESVEELGIGVILSALVLYLIGQISAETSRGEVVGKVALEAAMVAIGVSIGTAQLGAGEGAGRDQGMTGSGRRIHHASASDLIVGFCGAVVVAGNVAPTEEIPMIATETDSWKLVLLALLSMAVAAMILFFANFVGSPRYHEVEAIEELLAITGVTYAVAAAASAAMLWFFGRFDGHALATNVSQVVVLAFPAVVGASAGRLLLQARQ